MFCIVLEFVELARILRENVAQKGDRPLNKINICSCSLFIVHCSINSFNSNVFKKQLATHILIYHSSQLAFWAVNRFPKTNFLGWYVHCTLHNFINRYSCSYDYPSKVWKKLWNCSIKVVFCEFHYQIIDSKCFHPML